MTYIKKIEIGCFGKFKNYEFEFTGGLNEFILENEFGKSTVTDFIVFMFYGFVKTSSAKIPLMHNYLKKYMPWDGGDMISGALELVKDGMAYRIERTQRATGRMNFSLRTGSGEEIAISVSPGEYFFGVDSDTFLRTFALRQTDMNFFKTDGIETALKNLVTTGDEDTSFEDALNILKTKKSQYQHGDRKTGRIFTIPKEIAAINEQTASSRRALSALEESVQKLAQVKDALLKIAHYENEANHNIEKARKNDAARILEKVKQTDAQIKEYQSKFNVEDRYSEDGLTLADRILSTQEVLLHKKEQIASETKDLENEYLSKLASFPQYELIKQNREEFASLSALKSKTNFMLLAAGIILMVAGGALCVLNLLSGAVLSGVGAIAVILSFIFKAKVKIPAKFNMTHEQLCKAFETFCLLENKIELSRSLFEKSKQNLAAAEKQLADNSALCEKCGFKTRQEVANARAQLQNKAVLQNHLNDLLKKRKELLSGKTVEELIAYAKDGDIEGITEKEAFDELQKLTVRKQQYLELHSSLSKSGQRKAELEQLIFENEKKIAQLEEELSVATYNNDVLDIAISALTEAYDKINSIYSPIISEKAKPALVSFTDGKYDSLYLDKNFELRLRSGIMTNSIQYFSKGTQEAVYFAVRVAMAEILSGEANLPLILDDPFWSLDIERTKKAKEFLTKLSTQKQIIVFSAK